MIFLTDNSTWISMGISTITFLLVVVTLHKINCLSGRIRTMEQCRMAESRSVEQERKDSAVKEENIHMEQESLDKAAAEGLCVLRSPLSGYEICGRMHAAGVPDKE